ncbi:MAG: hypothetical protein WCK35_01510 [Chloroflexota bacterium]
MLFENILVSKSIVELHPEISKKTIFVVLDLERLMGNNLLIGEKFRKS